MEFSFCHIHEHREVTISIEAEMQFDGSLGFSKSGPWEDAETEVDDCCIEQIDFAIELESVFRSIELATVEQ